MIIIVLKYYIDHSKPVISEIEFASYFCSEKICVTGTNGKTTTTLMVSYILKKLGKSKSSRNIGESCPFSCLRKVRLLCMSSFQ